MTYDFINTYYPSFDEISSETLFDVRQRLEAYLREQFPDVDMAPNSVFGDLILTPATLQVAAMEEAVNRCLSDLDLANVARGVIYNCPFVEEYLKNFAADQDQAYESYGTIRLVLSEEGPYTLERNFLFQLGTSVFRPRVEEPGSMLLVESDGSLPFGASARKLIAAPDGGFYVDVPVIGDMPDPVLSGAAASISRAWPQLISSTAVGDFVSGTTDYTLPELAKRSRNTFFSATPTTKAGFRNFAWRQFPGSLTATAVSAGDRAMTRSVLNPIGLATPAVDLYMRSASEHTDTFVVAAEKIGSIFVGELDLPGHAHTIDSIAWASATDTLYKLGGANLEIYTQTTDNATAPGWTCGMSLKRKVYFTLSATGDAAGITTEVVGGKATAYFVVTYRQDPSFVAMSDAASSNQNALIGANVLTRGPVIMQVNDLTVKYRRDPGSSVNQAKAREEILTHVNNASEFYPLSSTIIADSLFYAGAADVQDVTISADVRWAPGKKLLDPAWGDILTSPANAPANSTGKSLVISTMADASRGFFNEGDGATVGPENCRYILDDANLNLVEVV